VSVLTKGKGIGNWPWERMEPTPVLKIPYLAVHEGTGLKSTECLCVTLDLLAL